VGGAVCACVNWCVCLCLVEAVCGSVCLCLRLYVLSLDVFVSVCVVAV